MTTSSSHYHGDSLMLEPFGPSHPHSKGDKEIFSWRFSPEDSLPPIINGQLRIGGFLHEIFEQKASHGGEDFRFPCEIWCRLEWEYGKPLVMGFIGSRFTRSCHFDKAKMTSP